MFILLQLYIVNCKFVIMKKLAMFIMAISLHLSVYSQKVIAEDFYVSAFNEISDMLAGKDSLSIKRAVYVSEWAFYEGNLDYMSFCKEIDRIVAFVKLFYDTNKLSAFKTGKQMALNEYFFRPYSGNGYKPYIYDFDSFFIDNESWETQFVSKVLQTHKGQCRSLPWMYKILAAEIKADVSLAYAPRHCYIMYKDEDKMTPEEWINLELTTQQIQPSFWIKQDFEISDSSVIVGTYMTPLTDIQTVASQMADLAFGYKEKFNRYDEFTFYCSSCSLEYFQMNPKAWIIRGKSLEQMIQDYLYLNGNVVDDYLAHLLYLLNDTMLRLKKTYMTYETEEMRERRNLQAKKWQYLQNKKE